VDEVAAEKAALRERMRRLREDISPIERTARSAEVERRLFDLPELAEARTFLVFASFGSEVPTAAIAARLAGAGRRVLLPFVRGRDMEAADMGPPGSLVATAYGPREPAERVAVDPGGIDAVVAPGLAFGRDGYRVGYGGGYFDRYLARMSSKAVRVGIAFHEQLLDSVPHSSRDEPLHYVVTDRETVDCRPGMPRPLPGQ